MIDIWVLDTSAQAGIAAADASAAEILSSDERRRARALKSGLERNSFITARMALRRLLAPYHAPLATGEPFDRSTNGKPRVAGAPAFNMSATSGIALIAISSDGEVGIDIEQIRDVPSAAVELERNAALSRLADPPGTASDGPTLRFLRAWTRLEASLKRDGATLGSALSPLSDQRNVRPMSQRGGREAEAVVTDLSVRHGYVAACAHRAGAELHLHQFDWNENGG